MWAPRSPRPGPRTTRSAARVIRRHHRHAQLAVREGLHRRGHRRHRRVFRLAARDRDRGAGPAAHPDRRGPHPYRAAVATHDVGHHGARPDRHGRRRRDDRHRHGAVGHQGQGARHAGLEPARWPGARQDPHLCARQHARSGAEPEGARRHGHQVRRRVRPGAQGRRAARSHRRGDGPHDRPARPAVDDARRRGAVWPARWSPTTCCSSRTRSRPTTWTATSASATPPTCRWRPANA
jgi:hypothetical protein